MGNLSIKKNMFKFYGKKEEIRMKNTEDLERTLERIDGRGYKAYNDIGGSYDFEFFILYLEHVQRDPFASPSLLRVEVKDSGFPERIIKNKEQNTAACDYVARSFNHSIHRHVSGRAGSGKSGVVQIDSGGQEVLERSCAKITTEMVELRFSMGLPASGRRIKGLQAKKMLIKQLPVLVSESCIYKNLDRELLKKEVELYQDVNSIRKGLRDRGLVAFVGDDSILPRESGVSDMPMKDAVPFKSPESLRVTFETEHHGQILGMGIPEGVTLIVGGGYHGKSTLLLALERGVYNHRYGDGREWVVTDPTAVKIRAEDGRRIESVDVSSFIHNPPMEKNTADFSTENASGSTSQAANIIEALEAGSGLLLFDEDTSATNFMIRDERMQRLVSHDKEPITPFIDRVRELHMDEGASTVMVMGGSGDYFEVADTVIMMNSYLPHDVTDDAMKVREEIPINRTREVRSKFGYKKRCPLPGGVRPFKGRKLKLDSRGTGTILMGSESIDVSQVEQLVDKSQGRAIAYAIAYASNRYMDGKTNMRDVVLRVENDIKKSGLDVIAPKGRKLPNNLARPRIFELCAAMNRLRTFKVKKMYRLTNRTTK